MNTFGQRLKWARERKGLSQPLLEKATGVKQQMISKLENGAANYTTRFMEIALVLDVSPGWLMTGVGPIEPNYAADKEFVDFMAKMTALTPRQREMLVAVAATMFAQPDRPGPEDQGVDEG